MDIQAKSVCETHVGPAHAAAGRVDKRDVRTTLLRPHRGGTVPARRTVQSPKTRNEENPPL